MVVDELYKDAADNEVSTGFSFNADVLQRAIKNIYERKYNPNKEIDGHLLEEVHRIINAATDIGFSGREADGEFMRQLKSNNGVFAAFKTHRMGRDIASRLIDDNGEVKSFQQFQQDVEPITSHHIDRWLRTEYDTAIKRAQQAADMMQYREEADVLPNLEWLPSTAMKPREDHMPFYHHIWAIDDPFWQKHKPGDQWGCQCDLAPTDAPVTDNEGLRGEPNAKPSKGLSGDPSRTGIIFSDDHPYFPSDCNHCVFNSNRFNIFRNKKKDCHQCADREEIVEETREVAHKETTKELKTAFLEVREQIKREFGYNTIIPIPIGDPHCTGQLYLKGKAIKKCLKCNEHTRSVTSKKCLLEIIRHPDRLNYIDWEILGKRKNLNKEKDRKNIERKKLEGVTHYTMYEFEYAGKTWIIGMQAIKYGYELPYYITLK